MEQAITGNLLVGGLVTTAVALTAILSLRLFLIRLIKGKADVLGQDQRRWLNRANNGTTILVLVCLVFIWAPQLQTFALSLTAVAVAIVLTTKELLMCLTGGFLRATTKPFDVGDWITVDGLTGEVMSVTALATMVEEIDTTVRTYQFTGRSVQIPNSKFLSSNVENANFTKDYIYYDIQITVQHDDLDPAELVVELRKISGEYYGPLREEAFKFNKMIEKKTAVNFADPDPQILIRTTDIAHTIYTVRMFMPTREAAKIGADITRDFLSYIYRTKSN